MFLDGFYSTVLFSLKSGVGRMAMGSLEMGLGYMQLSMHVVAVTCMWSYR